MSLFCSINLKLCSKQAVLLIITCIIDIFYEPQYLLDRIVAKSNSLGYFQSLCRASVGTWQLQIMSVWQASVLCCIACIADIDSFADANCIHVRGVACYGLNTPLQTFYASAAELQRSNGST